MEHKDHISGDQGYPADPGCSALVEPGIKFYEKHKALRPEVTRPAAKGGCGILSVKCVMTGKAGGRIIGPHAPTNFSPRYIFFSRNTLYFGRKNYISAIATAGNEFVLFTPLASYEISAAIDAICESYNLPSNSWLTGACW